MSTDIVYGIPMRITKDAFDAYPTKTYSSVPTYYQFKMLVKGKWHLCYRGHSFGYPFYVASPIVVILENSK